MQPSIPDILARAAYSIFERPLVHRDLMTILVKIIVSTAISPSWQWRPAIGDPGKFVPQDGTTAVFYHAVSIDHRGHLCPGPAYWALRRPIDDVLGPFQRDPDIFVLALHPEYDRDRADHRGATQWRFSGLETAICEGRSIEVETARRRTAETNIEGLLPALGGTHRSLMQPAVVSA